MSLKQTYPIVFRERYDKITIKDRLLEEGYEEIRLEI